MLYFPTAKAVLFHVPKTGGTTARELIKCLGIPHQRFRPGHGDYESFERLNVDVEKVAYFHRHPADWIRSIWCDRMEKGWGGELRICHSCANNDFNEFVKEVVDNYPGYITELFQRYEGPSGQTYHLRTDNLIEDLLNWLQGLNIRVDATRLYEALSSGMGARNLGQRKWLRLAQFEPEVYAKLCVSERELLDKFLYEG